MKSLYQASSLKFFEAGGYPITLTTTWSATWSARGTSDVGAGFTDSGAFGTRSATYATRFQVREVRSVLQQGPAR